MYVANAYIGGKYVPGEVIRDELPDEVRDWLLKAGAISRIAPAPSVEPPETPPPAGNERTNPDGSENAQLPAQNEQTEPEDEAESATEEDADDEQEPPQIDVMEAIVPAQNEETPNAPKKTGGRKKAK